MHRNVGFFDMDKNQSGKLTTQLSDDSRIMHKATGEAVAKQLQALFTFVVGLIIGFQASWKIALVTLATFPCNIIAGAIQMAAVSGQQYDQKGKKEGDEASMISSAFTHMRTISAYSMQFTVCDKYSISTRVVSEERQSRSVMAGVGFGGSNFSMFATYALLFWYGAQLIGDGEINFQQLMTAIMSLMLGTFG